MSSFRAYSMLLTAAFLWGAGNVAQQTILNDLGPWTAVGLRSLIAAMVLLPFVMRRGELTLKMDSAAWRLALVVSASFAAAAVFQQAGSGLTTVGNASFLISTCAILTPLAAFLLLGHRPSKCLGLAALAVIVGTSMISGSAPVAFGAGDGLMLVAAALFALWTISLSVFVKKHGRPLYVIFLQSLTTGIVCTAVGLSREPSSAAHFVNAIPELAVLGVFSSGFAYVLQSLALSRATASQAAIIGSAEAIFGALGGVLLLGEHIDQTGTCGMILVATGMVFAQLPERWVLWPNVRTYSGRPAMRSAETTISSLPASL